MARRGQRDRLVQEWAWPPKASGNVVLPKNYTLWLLPELWWFWVRLYLDPRDTPILSKHSLKQLSQKSIRTDGFNLLNFLPILKSHVDLLTLSPSDIQFPSDKRVESWGGTSASNNKRVVVSEKNRVSQVAIRDMYDKLQQVLDHNGEFVGNFFKHLDTRSMFTSLLQINTLTAISLFGNGLNGEIADLDFAACTPSLEKLWLNDNYLEGRQPKLEGCKNLRDLSLCVNCFEIEPKNLPIDAWLALNLSKLSFDFQGEPFFVNNVKDDENENDENENDNNNDEEGDNNKIATLLEHLRQFQFLEEDDA